ncbi:MAG: DUF3179 domain-containing protein [Chloroflexi bacterium]|nr:DUF3179 domain-containing protein [Chloroflexota bacterium]
MLRSGIKSKQVGQCVIALAAIALAFSSQIAPVDAELSCEQAPPPFDDPSRVEQWRGRGWQTDFCHTTIPYDVLFSGEMLQGCPFKDCIPAIHDPEYDTIEGASNWLQPQSPVIAVALNGEAKAFPLGILISHEIVNDTLAGQPVTVTYCPLCNSGIVFSGQVGEAVLTFGVSGFLRNSDLIMYDRQTDSWWQQLTGEGFVGTYAGTILDVLPSQLVGFGAFAEQYPDGWVLRRPGGRRYNTNPYARFNYDTNDSPFLFNKVPDPRLRATERVLAGVIAGQAVAIPFHNLAEERVIQPTIAGVDRELVAFWQPGNASAMDQSNIDLSRDVGMAVLFDRTYEGRSLSFTWHEDGHFVDEETSSHWNIFGTAVAGELAGAQLRQRIAAPHFWFAWAAFQPETWVYGQDS